MTNASHLSKAGLFVLPSKGEGLSLAYLEALCMGVPIIGYPPNVKFLSEHLGLTVGYAFNAKDGSSDALAELIQLAIGRKGLFSSTVREEIRSRARKAFSEPRFVSDYLATYERVSCAHKSYSR